MFWVAHSVWWFIYWCRYQNYVTEKSSNSLLEMVKPVGSLCFSWFTAMRKRKEKTGCDLSFIFLGTHLVWSWSRSMYNEPLIEVWASGRGKHLSSEDILVLLMVWRLLGNFVQHTLGTISWQQGNLYPSFMLLSVSNQALDDLSSKEDAILTHLCFLPMQTHIYIW